MCNLGPILNEESKPYFHREWEHRVFPLFASLFVGGHFNMDKFRRAVERMGPIHYLEASYHEHWLHAFETLLLEKGVITIDELWGGSIPTPYIPGTSVLAQDIVAMIVSTGASARVSHDIAPRFEAGDQVRTKNINPATYIHLPRYARGKTGRIETDYGVLITPDTAAHDLGEHPQHVCSVSFTALKLWGTPRSGNMYIDLWDDYLEEA